MAPCASAAAHRLVPHCILTDWLEAQREALPVAEEPLEVLQSASSIPSPCTGICQPAQGDQLPQCSIVSFLKNAQFACLRLRAS